jgi:AbiV family abortive infection protein
MSTDHEEALAFLKGALEKEEEDAAHSPSLKAILQNARRLLDDAGLLYANERFASATALAILAVEEKGKYMMAKWAREERSIVEGWNDHIKKQLRFATLTYSDVFLTELAKQLDRVGLIIKRRTQMTEQERQWADRDDQGSFTRLGKNKVFMDALLKSVFEHEDARLMARVQNKEINKLKQRCMYVDVNNDFEVMADPADISQDTASYFPSLARRFIGRPE